MERQNLIFGAVTGFLIIMAAYLILSSGSSKDIDESMILKIKDAEISLDRHGTSNIAGLKAKYASIHVDYYYRYEYCLDNFNAAAQKFKGMVESDSKKIDDFDSGQFRLPDISREYISVAVAGGQANLLDYGNHLIKTDDTTTIIADLGACSEKILTSIFCNLLENPPEACSRIDYSEKESEEVIGSEKDSLCYETCNVKYLYENNFITQLWQGPPCSKIPSYVQGASWIKSKDCGGKSCKPDDGDNACCKPDECVDNGKCHAPETAKDTNGDGNLEICANDENRYAWINPDSSAEACTSGKFHWFECTNKEECKYGINDYSKKSDGLCCGDDQNEAATKCDGVLCEYDDGILCCPKNSCALNGKCYPSGCNQMDLEGGEEISAYCDGSSSKWQELDQEHCEECTGKLSWSGTRCCGDDVGEGKYAVKYAVNSKEHISTLLFYGCIDKRSNCVYPFSDTSVDEGLYISQDNSRFLSGAYYCKESQWYTLDFSSKYCKEAGYYFDSSKQSCCGDNPDEFSIKGEDGTLACCNVQTDKVIGGRCIATNSCGNNNIDSGEQCESPNTENNNYCPQGQNECLGSKLGARSGKGYCNYECGCEQTDFEYKCAKGACGAQCSSDADCGSGEKCNPDSCGCESKTYCGDNVLQRYNDDGQREECELPGTTNSTYCRYEQCRDNKAISTLFVSNLTYGYCNDRCRCAYEEADYICIKGVCGAQCNDDGTGCAGDDVCNTNLCTCGVSLVCGNGVCESGEKNTCQSDCRQGECPYGVNLETNKNNYNEYDSVNVKISVYDNKGIPIPDARFDLDVIVNGIVVGSSTYVTETNGSFGISRRITSYTAGGRHTFIAKTKVPECETVSDSTSIFVFVRNPYGALSTPINYSTIEFIVDKFNVTHEKASKSECGNNMVEYGEACEGKKVCRRSDGCDRANRVYDVPETCGGCSCPADTQSGQDDGLYCDSCNSCGDGAVNCGEQCENGTLDVGFTCNSGRLYFRTDSCINCKWVDEGIKSYNLVSACECKCPANPETNCINGNYVNYTKSYNAGCSDGKCNECGCSDNYNKDSNNDGIEDKCSPEFCSNKIDDNDNGLVDEYGCVWQYCSQCGYGLFSLCTRQECAKFREKCFFSRFETLTFKDYSLGECFACSSAKGCEDYGYDKQTCILNPCGLKDCMWQSACCTDNDKDGICDLKDNCPGMSNANQLDSDADGIGDMCERCSELDLFLGINHTETRCSDGIDNECDGLLDCMDDDCIGAVGCCTNASDCPSSCMQEKCVRKACKYEPRSSCDNSECGNDDEYCDIDGKCKLPELSKGICLNCVEDRTKQDYGIGYVSIYNSVFNVTKFACCGNNDYEFYIFDNETKKSACCNSAGECIDENSNCVKPESLLYNNTKYCLNSTLQKCSALNVCSEIIRSFNSKIYCIYNGTNFVWNKNYSREICSDNFDNDCDSKIDMSDEDCKK